MDGVGVANGKGLTLFAGHELLYQSDSNQSIIVYDLDKKNKTILVDAVSANFTPIHLNIDSPDKYTKHSMVFKILPDFSRFSSFGKSFKNLCGQFFVCENKQYISIRVLI